MIRHNLGHSKPSLPLRHTTTIPSQAKDSTGPERAAQAAEKTEAERKKEERLCHTKLKLQKTQNSSSVTRLELTQTSLV